MKKAKRSLFAMFLIVCLFIVPFSSNAACGHTGHVDCVDLVDSYGNWGGLGTLDSVSRSSIVATTYSTFALQKMEDFIWIDFWGWIDDQDSDFSPWRPVLEGVELVDGDGITARGVGMVSYTASNYQAARIHEVATSHHVYVGGTNYFGGLTESGPFE